MTEPTLDPLVQRAMLNNDVVFEALPCDPDMADTGCLLFPLRLRPGAGGECHPRRFREGRRKLPNVVVVGGPAKPR
jgi:hypothetical protein